MSHQPVLQPPALSPVCFRSLVYNAVTLLVGASFCQTAATHGWSWVNCPHYHAKVSTLGRSYSFITIHAIYALAWLLTESPQLRRFLHMWWCIFSRIHPIKLPCHFSSGRHCSCENSQCPPYLYQVIKLLLIKTCSLCFVLFFNYREIVYFKSYFRIKQHFKTYFIVNITKMVSQLKR